MRRADSSSREEASYPDALAQAPHRWQELLDGADVAEPRSSLAKDDSVFPSMPCSAVAWGNLHSARAAFARASESFATVGEPLDIHAVQELRSALVLVSHSLTVLGTGRRLRVDAGLRMAWTAFTRTDARNASLASLAPFPSPLVAGPAHTLLRARRFEASPAWFDISSVRVAAGLMRARSDDPDLFEAVISHLWHGAADAPVIRDDAIACAETVAAMIDRAVELWLERRSASVAVAAPAAEASTAPPEPSSTSLFVRAEPVKVDAFALPVRRGRRRRQ